MFGLMDKNYLRLWEAPILYHEGDYCAVGPSVVYRADTAHIQAPILEFLNYEAKDTSHCDNDASGWCQGNSAREYAVAETGS